MSVQLSVRRDFKAAGRLASGCRSRQLGPSVPPFCPEGSAAHGPGRPVSFAEPKPSRAEAEPKAGPGVAVAGALASESAGGVSYLSPGEPQKPARSPLEPPPAEVSFAASEGPASAPAPRRAARAGGAGHGGAELTGRVTRLRRPKAYPET